MQEGSSGGQAEPQGRGRGAGAEPGWPGDSSGDRRKLPGVHRGEESGWGWGSRDCPGTERWTRPSQQGQLRREGPHEAPPTQKGKSRRQGGRGLALAPPTPASTPPGEEGSRGGPRGGQEQEPSQLGVAAAGSSLGLGLTALLELGKSSLGPTRGPSCAFYMVTPSAVLCLQSLVAHLLPEWGHCPGHGPPLPICKSFIHSLIHPPSLPSSC